MTDSAPSNFYILWGSVILGCLMLVGLKKNQKSGTVTVWSHADNHLPCCLSRRSQCPHPRCRPHSSSDWCGSGTSQTTSASSSQSLRNDSSEWGWELERKRQQSLCISQQTEKLFTISFNKPCLITLTVVAKEISFVSTRRSNNINRYIYKKKNQSCSGSQNHQQ